jgi:hypothetical protein
MEYNMKTIEAIMMDDGWERHSTWNAGREYIEFHKNGLIIDLDNIIKEASLK